MKPKEEKVELESMSDAEKQQAEDKIVECLKGSEEEEKED